MCTAYGLCLVGVIVPVPVCTCASACVCVCLVQRLGVSPHSLAQLVSETFNEMIFIHGDVHCDPHAANMVRGYAFIVLLTRQPHSMPLAARFATPQDIHTPYPCAGSVPRMSAGGWALLVTLSHICCAGCLTAPLSLSCHVLRRAASSSLSSVGVHHQLVRKGPSGSTQLLLADHGLHSQIADSRRCLDSRMPCLLSACLAVPVPSMCLMCLHCLLLQLVRKGPTGSTQLVLLDHGLYRQIHDDFRREYAALWRALILADKPGIKKHAEGMNAGDAYP